MNKEITVWSEGTQLSANLFLPEAFRVADPCPAILLCHGWGGPKEHLNNTYAPYFASAGFICMTFDYRGWFTSDARLVSDERQKEPDENGFISIKVKPVRNVVDPFDQFQDIISCLDYLESEPGVDPLRIGIWGSSFGCGHAIYVAGCDQRIKCMVAQVGGPSLASTLSDVGSTRAAEKARGVYGSQPPSVDAHETLTGKPDYAKMARYIPNVDKINVPSLLIDQADEELFDRMNQLPVLYDMLKGRVPVSYHTFPGKHYDIYEKNYGEGSELARDWFLKYL